MKIFLAGHKGLVGSAIYRKLIEKLNFFFDIEKVLQTELKNVFKL